MLKFLLLYIAIRLPTDADKVASKAKIKPIVVPAFKLKLKKSLKNIIAIPVIPSKAPKNVKVVIVFLNISFSPKILKIVNKQNTVAGIFDDK